MTCGANWLIFKWKRPARRTNDYAKATGENAVRKVRAVVFAAVLRAPLTFAKDSVLALIVEYFFLTG